MSIETAITAAQGKVADCYTAISNKGGTLPQTQNLTNMPTAIGSIPSGGGSPTIDSLSITPSTSAQTFTASGGVDGYSPVTVSAVTSSIDNNIASGNIKSGVSILGVNGSVVELKGETRTVSITSTSGNTFTPTSGKNGITSITVTPTNASLSITPTTSSQTNTVPSGYSGYGTVSVSAVDSSIDANITAGNIKKDVPILGVTGTYEGENSGTKYGVNINTLIGDIDNSGVLKAPSEESDVVFTGVKKITSISGGLPYKFQKSKIKTVSFPDLEEISSSMLYTFSTCTSLTSVSFPKLKSFSGSTGYTFVGCTALTSFSFPELTSISGANCFDRFFRGCTSLKTITFSKLESITQATTMSWAFSGCTALENVYFYGLKTVAQTSAFSGAMSQTGNTVVHRLHFPVNMQSTISGMSGYPLFGGTSGYVSVIFDLPNPT